MLQHTNWRIAELWLHPVTRLKRLSQRREAFDRVENPDAEDLSFLPAEHMDEVRELIAKGHITPSAIATVREETISYGNAPYDKNNHTDNYHCFVIDGLTPDEVTQNIKVWIG